MNLEESDSFKEKLERNNRHRKGVVLSIVLCACLIALLFILILILKYQDSITEKLFLDKKQISIPKEFYFVEDDTIYLNIKEVSNILNYTYTKGEYNKFNEDEDSCYLQNDFEIVSMSVNSSKYKKYVNVSTDSPTIADIKVTMKNSNGYNETFNLKHPLKFVNEKIYASVDDVKEMLNVSIDWQKYRFKFYSLDYLVSSAREQAGKAGIAQISGYYENLKAVLYGYIIAGNPVANGNKNTTLFGVVDFSGKEIISIKYDDIKFVQNTREFYITVSNGTMGILDENGGTIIAPSEFQDISLLDDENQLYLVEKSGEYGVVNRNGKIIIYAENDQIGYDTTKYNLVDIPNNLFLLNTCIPVKKDGKYGLYNKEGDLVLGIAYTDLGYKTTSKSTTAGNEQSVLIIPPSVGVNGIVINLNDLYGIFDVTTQKILLPCSFSKIYAITKSGETTYYAELGGEQINLADYLKENGLNNVDEEGNPITVKSSEENENQNIDEDENSNEEQDNLKDKEVQTSDVSENLLNGEDVSNTLVEE